VQGTCEIGSYKAKKNGGGGLEKLFEARAFKGSQGSPEESFEDWYRKQ